MNVAGSVTVGYGVAVGGSYSQSKINADHASVNEQAGIYTGNDGYNINVNKHTDLKGLSLPLPNRQKMKVKINLPRAASLTVTLKTTLIIKAVALG